MKVLPLLESLPARSAEASDDASFGALSTARGCLPLQGLSVHAHIEGLVAEVALSQVFVNVHEEALEATYIFPLPDRAAVTRFRLEAGGRVVEGELKERGVAREEYDRALRTGQRAAITEEERPGVFTLRVGNLPPGETAAVHLSLVGPLACSTNEATFQFPLVVAPRYIPGVPLPGLSVGDGTGSDTNAVPDASRITPPVLLPGFPNPVALSLTVDIVPGGLPLRDFRSSLHTILYSEEQGRVRLRLQPGERLDRDFILRFCVGGAGIATSLAVRPDREGDEGTFLLTLVPPDGAATARPRDVVFVLDRSGSMSGWKMVAARRALARMVDTLVDQDRFGVLAFDDRIEMPGGWERGKLMPATDRNRFRAVEFLARIDARGGTEMAQPLDQALTALTADLPRERRGKDERQRVLVLVTDGQVGNEDQLLRMLGERIKQVRTFTLGIDQAVNAGLLRRLAELGGGHSATVESEDRLEAVMDQLHRHIGTPVLTGLHLEPRGLTYLPDSLTPDRIPDLFSGTPLFVHGRYRGSATGALALQARDGAGGMWSACVEVCRTDSSALAILWARGRLRALEDKYVTAAKGREELQKQVLELSLRFGVLCRFTAYVAVDRREVVNPTGKVHSIVQPVDAPAGWEKQDAAAACLSMLQASPPVARSAMSLRRRGASAPVPGTDRDRKSDASAGDSDEQAVDSFLGDEFDLELAEEDKEDCGNTTTDFDPTALNAPPTADSARRSRQSKRELGKARKYRGEQARGNPVLALFEILVQVPGTDVGACRVVLAGTLRELEELVRSLQASKDKDGLVRRLEEAVQQAKAVLNLQAIADAELLKVYQEVVAALRGWLEQQGGIPKERKEFWK